MLLNLASTMSGTVQTKGKACHLGDGKSIHVQRWVNYFAKNGWEVDLISFRDVDRTVLHPKVIVHVVSSSSLPILGFLTSLYGTIKLLRRIKPDIIHAHSISSYGIYAGLYSCVNHLTPFILTAWGFSHIKKNKGLKRWLDRNAVKKADIITTLVFDMKFLLAREFKIDLNKIKTFPWGVDLKIFYRNYENEVKTLKKKLKISEKSFVVLSNRLMRPYYGINYIISAIPAVIGKYPQTIFVIRRSGGDPIYEGEMKKLAKFLGVWDNVRFDSEFIPYYEVPILYNFSDVSVMIPSTDQGPLSLFESMICGSIVIATDISGNREWITDGKNGFLIPSSNPEAIAEKIIYCIEHPQLKETFYNENKSLILEKGDWDKNAKIMENIYAQLLGRP